MSLAVCPGGWVPIPGQGMLSPSTLPVCSSCQQVWVRTSPQQTPPPHTSGNPVLSPHFLTLPTCSPWAMGLASIDTGINAVSFPHT